MLRVVVRIFCCIDTICAKPKDKLRTYPIDNAIAKDIKTLMSRDIL
jgi:hypothetical protein